MTKKQKPDKAVGANRKKGTTMTSKPADQVLVNPVVDEAASVQLRLHRATIMRRNAKKIARARELARQRLARAVQMRRRALKRARSLVRSRVAGAQGMHYNKLSMSDKIAIDRMTDKRKKQIIRIANKLAPRIKRDELQRLAAVAAGKPVRNAKTPIIASYEVGMTNTLNELDINTLRSYVSKASKDIHNKGGERLKANVERRSQEIKAGTRKPGELSDGPQHKPSEKEVKLTHSINKRYMKIKKAEHKVWVKNTTPEKMAARGAAAAEKHKQFKSAMDDVMRTAARLRAQRNESVVNELHKDTLASYIKKAAVSAAEAGNEAGFKAGAKQPKYNTSDTTNVEKKRHAGIARAAKKLTERKDVMYTARDMVDVDFDNLPKVHTFVQHLKIKADVGSSDKQTSARKKAELIRRAAGEVNRKVVESADKGSVYVRTANRLTRSQSPQIADTKKRMIAALKNKDYNAVASIILYLFRNQLKGDTRIKQE